MHAVYEPLPPSQIVAEFAASTNVADMRVLDLSCGNGNNSLFLAQHGAEVLGVDDRPEMIRDARRRARAMARDFGDMACEFVEVDYQNLADGLLAHGAEQVGFDVVMAHQVLHALPGDQDLTEAFMRDMESFTKVGGVNVVTAQLYTGVTTDIAHKQDLTLPGEFPPGELRASYVRRGWRPETYHEEPVARQLKGGRALPALASIVARRIPTK
jgi:SAM-dependent methyltransferase